MFIRSRPFLFCLLLLPVLACSEAETPDAQFDAGVQEPGFDAGPGFGSRDEPCFEQRCESNDLVCVSETTSGGETANMCRLRCDRTDTTDPCGPASTCGRLQTDEGACLPAGGLDEDCPCDEGFACTLLNVDDAGQSAICKRTCARDNGDGGVFDAGNTAPCPADETCRSLQGNDELGVCIAD